MSVVRPFLAPLALIVASYLMALPIGSTTGPNDFMTLWYGLASIALGVCGLCLGIVRYIE